MEFKESKTYANLLTAFAGESQAHTKYSYYAAQSRKEGYEQFGAIFDETSHNEREHAEIWFKYLHGESMPDTMSNLIDCIAGEHYEWADMYKHFAEEARAEGYEKLAVLFDLVGSVEKTHEERFEKLKQNLEQGIVFTESQETVWLCRNCGYIHVGKQAPTVCPVCAHPQAYFERKANNY